MADTHPEDLAAEAAKITDTRHPRGTGASFVYAQLKKQILNLELTPGTQLDETELSRHFHLSRSPVREALIRLAAEGLVDAPRNRTSRVSQFDFSTLPAYFDAMHLLYRLGARQAAENSTPEGVERLREIERGLEEAHHARDILQIITLNSRFHTTIVEMGGNPFFVAWTQSLLDQGQRVQRFYMQQFEGELPAPKLNQHEALIAAIEAGDAAAAEAAGKADAQTVIDEVLAFIAERGTGDFAIS
ncbi:GntR family transcriptional regulator [Amorphus sp. MBR-141]